MSKMPNEHITEFAKISPITFEVACNIFGNLTPDLSNAKTRAEFFAVWAAANFEFGQAMNGERIELANAGW